MTFKKAERRKAKLRLGIAGVSGSGKTWSALEIASGMGGKIALIDTEAGRAELYGEDFEYDCMRLDAPYSVDKYVYAIKEAEKLNYDILIIDSLSHAWAGEGGILSFVEQQGGNNFSNGWKKATPKQNLLVDTIITSKLHIIVTMRTKSEYSMEKNEHGKIVPRKIGLAPVQREGLEYEFTLFMDISSEHLAHVTKDNTKLFDQQYIIPNKKMGEDLMVWLTKGKDALCVDDSKQVDIEYFDNTIRDIERTTDMDKLSEIYKTAYKSNIRYQPDLLLRLTEAKDMKKSELLQETKDKEAEKVTSLNETDSWD